MKRFWCSALLLMSMMIGAIPKLAAQPALPEPITATNLSDLKLLVDLPWQASGQDMDVQWSPDGRTVAIATKLGAQTFDLGKPINKPTMIYGGDTWMKCVDYVPDRSVVVTCDTTTSTAWLWDRHSGEKLATLNNGSDVLEYGRFSPDGKLLAIINGFQGGIYVWGVNGGKDAITPANARQIKLLILLDHGGYTSNMSFSADSSLLASDGSKGLYIWDLSSFQPNLLQTYDNDTPIYSVAFRPDGQWVVIGTYMENHYLLRMINVTDASKMRDFSSDFPIDAPNDVNFSPDGKLLVSAHNDGQIIIWNVEDGRVLRVIKSEHGLAWRAVFNRDGTLLATLNFNDGVRIWGIDDALALIPKPVLALNSQAVVTLATAGDVLNMRAEAGTKGALLVQLKTNTVVTLVDGPKQADNLTWWKIRAANGMEGWVVESVDGEQTLTPDS